MIKEIFQDYIKDIVQMTFGFEPQVRIETPTGNVVRIFLDGDEGQRKQMMGYHATTFNALKQILRCFSKHHKVYVFLFLEFQDDESNQIEY